MTAFWKLPIFSISDCNDARYITKFEPGYLLRSSGEHSKGRNFFFGVHRLPRASERRPFHEQAGNVVWGIAQELREELPFPAVTAEITRIEDSPALAFDEEGHRSKTGMIDKVWGDNQISDNHP